LIGYGSLACTRLTRREHDSFHAAASVPGHGRCDCYPCNRACGILMTRRMLLGLKQRAEALRASSTGDSRAKRTAAA
jgi:hypothetical protein